MIELTAEVDLFTQMEMFMKAIGKMIKLMEKESIPKMMVLAILESGLRIFSMVLELNDGRTTLPTRGNYFFTQRAP